MSLRTRMRSIWRADPAFAAAMARRWAELPDTARTPAQVLGRHGVGCEGTHGVFPSCNLACTPCYHSRDANAVRADGPHTVAHIQAQMGLLRRLRGPRAHAQLIGGEVTLLDPDDHAAALTVMRAHGREPMSFTHGDVGYDYLERLVLGPDGRRRLRRVSFAAHFDSLMFGRRGIPRPSGETSLNPYRRQFAQMFARLRREHGVRYFLAHNMTVTPANLGQVAAVIRDCRAMGYGMFSFQPAAFVGDDRRWHEDYRDITGDQVWAQIEAGAGTRLDYHVFEHGDVRCNRAAYGFWCGDRWHPWLDGSDPRDLGVRDAFFRYLGPVSFTGTPPALLIARLAVITARHPRILALAAGWLARTVRRAGLLRLLRHRVRPVSYVMHQFMDATEVAPAWELMQRGQASGDPRIRATQERLAACHYAMAHPETGALVPACVQHGVLDPEENRQLRVLLPIPDRPGRRPAARSAVASGPGQAPAVLIMAKVPVPGTVKTRLHPLLGPDGCAALAERLIRNAAGVATDAITAGVSPDRRGAPGRRGAPAAAVFVAAGPPGAMATVSRLVPAGTRLLAQQGANLGERLAAASGAVFAAGHRPVVVIGTDAPTLTPDGVIAAFRELAGGHDAVFGPALDGGYYLVGLNEAAPGLFALDPALWGGAGVLAASLAAARSAGLRTALLPALRDLDTPDDARALLADPALPGGIADVLRRRPCGQRGASSPAAPCQAPVSIVVPVLNEAAGIAATLRRLRGDFPGCELIVADGGSSDGTAELAAPLAQVVRSAPGRAAQMNAGARHAHGEMLWFIHADTRVDPAALGQIRAAMTDPVVAGGGLRLRFDQPSFALRYVAWTSNLRARYLHWVFGDQAMFIRRSVFEALGGFPALPLMEDLEMSRRLHRRGRLALLAATATTSARRFAEHGTWRTLAFMQYLKLLYFAGADPQRIADRYQAGPPRLPRPRRRPATTARRRATRRSA